MFPDPPPSLEALILPRMYLLIRREVVADVEYSTYLFRRFALGMGVFGGGERVRVNTNGVSDVEFIRECVNMRRGRIILQNAQSPAGFIYIHLHLVKNELKRDVSSPTPPPLYDSHLNQYRYREAR